MVVRAHSGNESGDHSGDRSGSLDRSINAIHSIGLEHRLADATGAYYLNRAYGTFAGRPG
jgi:hypothetical protein